MAASVVAASESTSDSARISYAGYRLTNPSPETIPALTGDENSVSKLVSSLEREVEADREQNEGLKDLRRRLDELIALNIANEESLCYLRLKQGHLH
jgi:hypothetical protein